MALIKIIPSPLSKKFTNVDGAMMEYSEEQNDLGQKSVRSMGEWKRERLPNSTQGERPISFSISKKAYKLKNYTSNSEELNALVKRCNLINDMRYHYDYNKPITSCDIFNIKDPFFNHKSLRLLLDEGYGVLNTENPIEFLLYEGVLANNKYQIGGEVSNAALNGRAKYIVVDSSIDKEAKKAARDARKTAEALIDNMSDDKKRSVALAMGLIVDGDSDISLITDLLEEAALDDKRTGNAAMSRQKYLIKLAEAPADELEARKYINKAFKGYIKRDRESNSYILFGVQIGKDKQSVINYLINPVNSETLYRLQKAIDLNEVND